MSVYRGSSGVVASTSGATSSPPSPMPPFSNLASTLLGSCDNAAFAVNLDTYATATDGYGNQTQYNRHVIGTDAALFETNAAKTRGFVGWVWRGSSC